ncbi:MAG: DUF2461 domain-containing protein [Bacteroidota bacterium]
MPAKTIYAFLEALTANNSKAWMDANRQWYHEARDEVVALIDPILAELKAHDPRIVQDSVRQSLNRINNNLMFHPNRPTYKDHFGIGIGYGKGLPDFYIELGVAGDMLAAGLWHPSPAEIKMVRTEIDYEGAQLAGILHAPAFRERFELFTDDALKGTPKGYPKDHPHIDLLRLKSIGAFERLPQRAALQPDFAERVISAFRLLSPMLDFLLVGVGK